MMVTYLDECLDIIKSNPGIDARSITKIIFDGDDSKSNLGKVQINLRLLLKFHEIEKRCRSDGIVIYKTIDIPIG